MIKPVALAVMMVSSYLPCLQAEQDETTLAERQKRAVQALSQYKDYYFSKEDILTNKYDEVLQNVDTLFQRFIPRYICELTRESDGMSIPVIFETEVQEGKLWAVNFLEKKKLNTKQYKGARRFFCASYFTVFDCGVTNCFGSSSADTLVIMTTNLYSNPLGTNRVYFTACSGYDYPLLTRIEGEDGYPRYSCLEMHDQIWFLTFRSLAIEQVFPISEDKMAEGFKVWTPPEILARFMILNTNGSEFPDNNVVRQLQSSESFTQVVGTLLKHPHPWVRAAANNYLINHSTLGRERDTR
jgi:hypothetical protein